MSATGVDLSRPLALIPMAGIGAGLAVGQFEDSGRQPLTSDLDPGQARLDSGHVLIRKAHLIRMDFGGCMLRNQRPRRLCT